VSGFEVPTAVDITTCSPLKVNSTVSRNIFGVEKYARGETSTKYASRASQLAFNGLHSPISLKMELYIGSHCCENLRSYET
jgi:hypothetical protein